MLLPLKQSGGWDTVLIKKSEIITLSDNIRKSIDGEKIDFRDNKEGALSVLKNDINTLVNRKEEQMDALWRERDSLTKSIQDISHQLKTPVTSMMIMADLLENAPAEKQTEFIYNIKSSLTRMEWLISSLLKMAKLDSGTVEFSKVNITTRELIQTALQPLAILLDVKSQIVEIANDIELSCDKRWTVEALTNLIKNASENSPRNSKIYIDSGCNPIYKWISITDCGSGIPKEKYATMFKRFEYSQNENGYGIGLPLALSIIRGQDGDIDVDDGGKGKGATFTVKFFK